MDNVTLSISFKEYKALRNYVKYDKSNTENISQNTRKVFQRNNDLVFMALWKC